MLASRFNQRFPKARRVSAAPRLLIALPYTARPKRRLVTPGEAPAARSAAAASGRLGRPLARRWGAKRSANGAVAEVREETT